MPELDPTSPYYNLVAAHGHDEAVAVAFERFTARPDAYVTAPIIEEGVRTFVPTEEATASHPPIMATFVLMNERAQLGVGAYVEQGLITGQSARSLSVQLMQALLYADALRVDRGALTHRIAQQGGRLVAMCTVPPEDAPSPYPALTFHSAFFEGAHDLAMPKDESDTTWPTLNVTEKSIAIAAALFAKFVQPDSAKTLPADHARLN